MDELGRLPRGQREPLPDTITVISVFEEFGQSGTCRVSLLRGRSSIPLPLSLFARPSKIDAGDRTRSFRETSRASILEDTKI